MQLKLKVVGDVTFESTESGTIIGKLAGEGDGARQLSFRVDKPYGDTKLIVAIAESNQLKSLGIEPVIENLQGLKNLCEMLWQDREVKLLKEKEAVRIKEYTTSALQILLPSVQRVYPKATLSFPTVEAYIASTDWSPDLYIRIDTHTTIHMHGAKYDARYSYNSIKCSMKGEKILQAIQDKIAAVHQAAATISAEAQQRADTLKALKKIFKGVVDVVEQREYHNRHEYGWRRSSGERGYYTTDYRLVLGVDNTDKKYIKFSVAKNAEDNVTPLLYQLSGFGYTRFTADDLLKIYDVVLNAIEG